MIYLGVMQALDKKQEMEDKQMKDARLKPGPKGGKGASAE